MVHRFRTTRLGLSLLITAIAVGGPESTVHSREPARSRIAILHEPDLPVFGAGSSPETLRQILAGCGAEVELLAASDLAERLNKDGRPNWRILIVPTGESFPAAPRDALVQFLRGGGDLVTLGGYAFNSLLRRDQDRWIAERDYVRAQLLDATAAARSLVQDGGFESADPAPLDDGSRGRQWRRSGDACFVTTDAVAAGRRAACVSLPPAQPAPSGTWSQHVPLTPGRTYEVTGRLRAADLSGPGIAYLAVYQRNEAGQHVAWRDFGCVRTATEWTTFRYRFTTAADATHVRIQCGLYQTSGTAWFDEIGLWDVTGLTFQPLNTATGGPGDGLDVAPQQLGIFDASYPLRRAARLRTAADQWIVTAPIDMAGSWSGWAASGVVGNDNARWQPLLETVDRYGRPRGPAAALLMNYNGYYAGSWWAYFGIDNQDLFANATGPTAQALRQVVQFMLAKTWLHSLHTEHRLLRRGEPLQASVVVENLGPAPQSVTVCFRCTPAGDFSAAEAAAAATAERACDLPPGQSQRIAVELGMLPDSAPASLWQIEATLLRGRTEVDRITTGVVTECPSLVAAGPPLRFQDNYFQFAGRPLFLFGTDTHSRLYLSAAENPLTWHAELRAARDIGVNLFENLQYSRPGHRLRDADWRDFQALAQLTQDCHMAFMPGMLIGHNTAIGDGQLAEQSALCGEYARRFADTPGLLYYINGDYQLRTGEQAADIQTLWQQWLRQRYTTLAALRTAWAPAEVGEHWETLAFPPPNTGHWQDVPAIDKTRFENWLTERWNQTHVAAVRCHDHTHAITSEYYQRPSSGLDLPLTISDQDVANIGYFDEPVVDADRLPLALAFNDLRIRGRGCSLGEYGVKTHPAWQRANGATGYHLARSEEEQRQWFVTVAHYALGQGCCKIQNWCLRDGQVRVFPWGLFYPNQLVPKDVAAVHRNLSMVWRHLVPRYAPAPVTLCLPNHLRIGNQPQLGLQVAERAAGDLLALHVEFNTVDDAHIEALPAATRVLVYPAPLALADDDFDRLCDWVGGGGQLWITGDFARDANRRHTRAQRLEQLAGVRLVTELATGPRRDQQPEQAARFAFDPPLDGMVAPCVQIEPISAEVLGRTADRQPVLVRNRLDNGQVWYLTDPLEMSGTPAARDLRRALLSRVLAGCGVPPLEVTPDVAWLHVFRQPTVGGLAHVVCNTRRGLGRQSVQLATTAGHVRLDTRNRWPALAVTTTDGRLVAAGGDGNVAADGIPIVTGSGQLLLLALDGRDLRRSAALLLAPLEAGRISLPGWTGAGVAAAGEFVEGSWVTYETLPLDAPGCWPLVLDADRATCLVLLCRPDRQSYWQHVVSQSLVRPETARMPPPGPAPEGRLDH